MELRNIEYLEDYRVYLSKEEIDRLNKETIQFGKNMIIVDFEMENVIKDAFDGVFHLKDELNEYGLKIMNMDTNYKQLYAYYEKTKGIDLYDNPDKVDISGYHIWFAYECEAMLGRLISIVDAIHHIIKVAYKLNVYNGLRFNEMVLIKLKRKNARLCRFLNKHLADRRFTKIKNMRNDFVHNRSPLTSKPLLKVEKQTSIMFKTAHGYVTPKEMLDYIEEYHDWLEELVGELRKYILLK